MSNNPNSEQNDQPPLPSSLRFALIAVIIATIEDVFVILANIEAIDEFTIADEEVKKEKKEIDEEFQKMQQQIDELTREAWGRILCFLF